MERCKIKPGTGYHKHYPDTKFTISGYDGKMVNLTYIKYGHKSSICIPSDDIELINDLPPGSYTIKGTSEEGCYEVDSGPHKGKHVIIKELNGDWLFEDELNKETK